MRWIIGCAEKILDISYQRYLQAQIYFYKNDVNINLN